MFSACVPVAARASVELFSDGVEEGLIVQREVGSLGEVLAEQLVGVLVETSLPG